jgi:predicted esterase
MQTEVAGMKKEHFAAAVLVLAALVLVFRPLGQSAQSVEAQIDKLEERVMSLVKRRPAGVTEGSLTTIEYQIDEAKRFWKKEGTYAERCMAKAKKYMDLAEKGQDPLSLERGIVARGYKSPYSRAPQPYSVYVPEGYRSDKSYGLVLNLHGGSSTHNLFLAVTLGNWGLPWATYWQIRHDEFKTQINPKDHLVAAPDGFGQIRWRWMAEMDVLSVVQDIRLHYNIDPKRVALCGLSNGGIGAYAIGTKYASRFSGVFSMAGISDWLLFHKASSMADWSKKIHEIESGINYAMNAKNTYYHFVHGEKDSGPMKVGQARAMDKRLSELGVDHVYHEIPDYGHDIIWVLWGKGRILDIVDKHPKSMRPDEVWLETLSYRANRQHWLELAQMEAFLDPARIKAKADRETNSVDLTTKNVEGLIVHLFESPLDWTRSVSFNVNGQIVEMKAPADGRVLLHASSGKWKAEAAADAEPAWTKSLRKVPGLSGPMTDINYDRQIHVYGSQVDGDRKALKTAAELGARNWMQARQFVEVDFPVKSDSEITEKDMAGASLVLYGTWEENSLVRKLGSKLPIKVLKKGIELRGTLYDADDVGAVFIFPNPLAGGHYVMLVTGNSLDAVLKGNAMLPYLPDYVVFDKKVSAKSVGRTTSKSVPFIGAGFFDEHWKLP